MSVADGMLSDTHAAMRQTNEEEQARQAAVKYANASHGQNTGAM